MPQLIVRRLDPKLVKALTERAAANGRSAEAEHRAILETVHRTQRRARDFKTLLASMPAVPGLRLRRSRDRGRSVKL